MKLIDLRDKVKAGFRPVVRFHKDVADLETYFEEDMFARLIKIGNTYDDHCGFVFDCTEYEDHNVRLETANYYDEHGNACLTAHQANQYNPIEEMYLMYDDDSEIFFHIVEDEVAGLFIIYDQDETAEGMSYVEWLEEELRKAWGIYCADT